MQRLGMWASMYDCAIVLIGHLNKKEGTKGLYRSLGSIDVVAAARSVLQVERDAEKSDIRIVRQIKNSLAPSDGEIKFSITAEQGFKWLECTVQCVDVGMAVSIALNSAYHCKIGKEPEWVNDLFFAVMNMLPSLIITFVGFYLYAKNGVKPLIFGSTYTYTYTLNAIPVFPVAVILIRRLFKKCNNPYIPGIVAAILLCWLQVSCSFTIHARVFYGPMAALLP